MDLTDKKYTDLISAFNDWHDYVSINATMKHIGLECFVSQEEYHKEIQQLRYASNTYPKLPLNEAYQKCQSVNDITIAEPFISVEIHPSHYNKPCGSCGGGDVL